MEDTIGSPSSRESLQVEMEKLYREIVGRKVENLEAERRFYDAGMKFFNQHQVDGHFWCRNQPYMQIMLKLFAIQASHPGLDRFRSSALNQLSLCASCIDAYHTSTKQILKIYNDQYESNTVELFFTQLLANDRNRLECALKNSTSAAVGNAAPNATAPISLLYAMYEICAYPELLCDLDIHTRFAMTINLMVTGRAKTFTMKRVVPGLLLSLLSPQKNVRLWATRTVQSWVARPSATVESGCNSTPSNSSSQLALPYPEYTDEESLGDSFSQIWMFILSVLKSNSLEISAPEGVPLYLVGCKKFPITRSSLHFFDGLSLALRALDTNNLTTLPNSSIKWFSLLANLLIPFLSQSQLYPNVLFCYSFALSTVSFGNLKEHSTLSLYNAQSGDNPLKDVARLGQTLVENSRSYTRLLFSSFDHDPESQIQKDIEDYQLELGSASFSDLHTVLRFKNMRPFEIPLSWQKPFIANIFLSGHISHHAIEIYCSLVYSMLLVDGEDGFPIKFKIQSIITAYRILSALICELVAEDALILELFSFRNLASLVILDARCQRDAGTLAHPLIASLASSILSSILMLESKFERRKEPFLTNEKFWKCFNESVAVRWNSPLMKNSSLAGWVPEIHHSILAYIANINAEKNPNIETLVSFYQFLLKEISAKPAAIDCTNLRLIYLPEFESKASLLVDALITSFIYASKLSNQLARFCGFFIFPNEDVTPLIVIRHFLEHDFSESINSSLLRHSIGVTRSHAEPLYDLLHSFWIKNPADCDKLAPIVSAKNMSEVQTCQLFLATWKLLWNILQLTISCGNVNAHNNCVLAFLCNLFRHVLTVKKNSLLLPLPGFENQEEGVNAFAKYFSSCEWFSTLLSFIGTSSAEAERSMEKRLALELIEDLLYWWTERRAFLCPSSCVSSPNVTIIAQIRILLTSSGRLDEPERKRLTGLLNTYLQFCPVKVKPIMAASENVLTQTKMMASKEKMPLNMNVLKKKALPNDEMPVFSFTEHVRASKKICLPMEKKLASICSQENLRKLVPSYLSKSSPSSKQSSQICSKSTFISSRLKQVRAKLVKDTMLASVASPRRVAHQKVNSYETISTDEEEDKGDLCAATSDAILALSTSKGLIDLTGMEKHRPLGIDSGIQSKPIQVINNVVGTVAQPVAAVSKSSARSIRGIRPVLDLPSLQRKILSWNLEAITEVSGKKDNATAPENIPSKFTDATHYARIFEPLLLLECKAQVVKSIEEIGGLDSAKVFSSDNFDWSEYVLNSVNMIDDFYDVQFIFKPSSSSCGSTGPSTRKVGIFDVPLLEHDLAYLESCDKSLKASAIVVGSVSIKGGEAFITLRFRPGVDARWGSIFREGSVWKIMKITPLVTVVREYLALSNISCSPYLSFLLEPYLLTEKGRDISADVVGNTRQLLAAAQFSLNESQQLAIASALHKDAQISLIQGPPGTGKTTTLLALVYSILNRSSFGATGPAPVSLNNSRVTQASNLLGSMSTSTLVSSNRPILICAPSNAAVDEIVKRFLDSAAFANRSIVRVGSQEVISDDIRHISLDCLLEESEKAAKKYSADSASSYSQYLETFCSTNWSPCDAPKKGFTKSDVDARKRTVQCQLDEARSIFCNTAGSVINRIEETRAAARSRILQSASVIAATLSGSGHDFIVKLDSIFSSSNTSPLTNSYLFGYVQNVYLFSANGSVTFDAIVIDEACQAVELSTLIPLRYSAKRVILVGDPNQLPPTVISKEASSFAYEQSLFTRIQRNCPSIVNLLTVQYRMHPSISAFPSMFFYNGRLIDGPDNARATAREWHSNHLLTPYLFYDVRGQESKREEHSIGRSESKRAGRSVHSLNNTAEANVVLGLVKLLCSEFPSISFSGRIGIISPYRDQVRTIRSLILRNVGPSALKHIEVNTVDGFQGQEKEIIIFSCVRASSERSIGFLRDTRRLNVALTRAKCSLFIVGHSDVLSGFPIWDSLIKDAKERKVFVPFSGLHKWRELFNLSCKNLTSHHTDTVFAPAVKPQKEDPGQVSSKSQHEADGSICPKVPKPVFCSDDKHAAPVYANPLAQHSQPLALGSKSSVMAAHPACSITQDSVKPACAPQSGKTSSSFNASFQTGSSLNQTTTGFGTFIDSPSDPRLR